MSRLVVFDTETTGLTLHPSADPYNQPRLAEFAAIVLQDGEPVETVSGFINPEIPMPREAQKVNGITDEMLADAETFAENLWMLEFPFKTSDACVAHNLPFDRAIIAGEVARLDFPFTFPWPTSYCTQNLYTPAFGGHGPTLRALYKYVMGRELAQVHRALDDVRALVEIIQKEKLWQWMK